MGRDTLDSIRKLKELKAAREASGKKVSEHIQPVLQSAGPPKKIGLIGKLKIANDARKVYNQAKSNNFKIMKASYRTSLFGAGGLLTVAVNVANMLLDGDPATNPDWSVVIATVVTAAGLLFARDDKVSSEQAGAK